MKEFDAETFDYQDFIEKRFQIVDKQGKTADFKLNKVQKRYLEQDASGNDIILKARQQGFSSLITAIFTTDFILRKNSYSVVVADIEENATGLLDKVKKYLEGYQIKTGVTVPLKYNSRFELYNPFMNTTFIIGTAKNQEFGRSKTITNLHCSEVAFYSNIGKIIAGAGQAVVTNGRKIFETTANGFNDFKAFYEDARLGISNYKALFYKASDFYNSDFLAAKKVELKELYDQEYPESEAVAFVSSGQCYFEKDSLRNYLLEIQNNAQRA